MMIPKAVKAIEVQMTETEKALREDACYDVAKKLEWNALCEKNGWHSIKKV